MENDFASQKRDFVICIQSYIDKNLNVMGNVIGTGIELLYYGLQDKLIEFFKKSEPNTQFENYLIHLILEFRQKMKHHLNQISIQEAQACRLKSNILDDIKQLFVV